MSAAVSSRKAFTAAPLLAILLALLAAPGDARDESGRLDTLIYPSETRPVIVAPGGEFEARLTEEARLRLRGPEATLALAVEWAPGPDGGVIAVCHLPNETPSGVYAMEARIGDNDYRNERAVFVRSSFPESYLVAHMADPEAALTDGDNGGEGNLEVLGDVVAAVNGSGADLLLITGRLTANGAPAEHRAFLDVAREAAIPVIVAAARSGPPGFDEADAFVGPPVQHVWFGRDAFLIFDGAYPAHGAAALSMDARVHASRRETKPARWAVGVTDRYDQRLSMRQQISLFIDDPLDHLVVSAPPPADPGEAGEDLAAAFPWGGVPISGGASAAEGMIRYLEVGSAGIQPRPPEEAVSVAEPDEP